MNTSLVVPWAPDGSAQQPQDLSLFDGTLDDLGELSDNWPVALLSAAYGYSRGARFSAVTAAIYGVLGYLYPYASSVIFTLDAFLVQEGPSKRFAFEKIREAAERRMAKVAADEKRRRRAGASA